MNSILDHFEEQNHKKNSSKADKKEIPRENQNSKKKEFCGVHTARVTDQTNGHNNLSEMSPQEKVNFPKNIECEIREKMCDMKSPGAEVLDDAEMTTKDEPEEPGCGNDEKNSSQFSNEAPNTREEEFGNKHEDIADAMNPVSDVQLRNIARESKNRLASDSLTENGKSTGTEVTICADSPHPEDNAEPMGKKTEWKNPSSDIPSASQGVSEITVENISRPRSDLHSCVNGDPKNEEHPPPLLNPYEITMKSNEAQTEQSIYKLAYDENLTDKSSSPLDPELHMPYSVMNKSIIIHAVETDGEDGYENLDIFPPCYESECFVNKHVYINKLSLAAELLRAGEKLPYDAIISDDNDSYFNGNFYPHQGDAFPQEVTHQSGIARLAKDSISLGESIEMAQKVTSSMGVQKDDAVAGESSNRRKGTYFRYLTQRDAFVSPYLCCSIM